MTAKVEQYAVRWDGPPLSTASVQAAANYRDGVAALVAGIATSTRLLAAAVDEDPGFVLAHVALAVCECANGEPFRPARSSGVMQRGERQHVEIVNTALAGVAERHAADLRREHLLEFPGDLLIVWLPLLQLGQVGDGGVGGTAPGPLRPPTDEPEAVERTG